MKILVVGASGHIGSYLIKELVKDNHDVFAVMRGGRTPYAYEEAIWSKVKILKMSREELCIRRFLRKTLTLCAI